MGKSSSKSESLEVKSVKDFRKLMRQMVTCLKGFELMSINFFDSSEMMKSMCNGRSDSSAAIRRKG